ncbi:unnamed protein product [Paramecium sonneborni]|uniref:Uncharacterized protein n=1 Tax=Paramecium sonneborni TaxID=65129 RepID=A0A8S1M383_9CILI|nr:unnamed protein product [Paramecium sonneborni]
MKKNKKTNDEEYNKSEVVKRCQNKILNGCNKQDQEIVYGIKSSVSQRLSSTQMISLEQHI